MRNLGVMTNDDADLSDFMCGGLTYRRENNTWWRNDPFRAKTMQQISSRPVRCILAPLIPSWPIEKIRNLNHSPKIKTCHSTCIGIVVASKVRLPSETPWPFNVQHIPKLICYYQNSSYCTSLFFERSIQRRPPLSFSPPLLTPLTRCSILLWKGCPIGVGNVQITHGSTRHSWCLNEVHWLVHCCSHWIVGQWVVPFPIGTTPVDYIPEST